MSLKADLSSLHVEVRDDAEALKKNSRDTSVFERKPELIAYPKNADEVTQIAKTMPIGEAPGYLGLSSAMTPLQQRTAIASGALNSNDPRYKDPDALKYYQSQAFNSIRSPENIAPVEKQFNKSLSGRDPADDTIGAFLSALFHGIQQNISGVGKEYQPKTLGPTSGLPNYGVSQSTSGSQMRGAEGGGD